MTKQKQQVIQHSETAQAAMAARAAEAAQSAESRLDEALEESFPASDPIAIDMREPSRLDVEVAAAGGRKGR